MLDMLLDASAEIDLRSEKISSPLACAATMGRMEAVQLLAKRGARLELIMPDGTNQSAIDAAKNDPKIQQWLRSFYQGKEQGLESDCVNSDQEMAPVSTVDTKHSEVAGERKETSLVSVS